MVSTKPVLKSILSKVDVDEKPASEIFKLVNEEFNPVAEIALLVSTLLI